MGPRAAGSSRLGPLTHLVKIAPGTQRPAAPGRTDCPAGLQRGRRSRPPGASQGRGSRVQGKAGRDSSARGTGDHPRWRWGESAPSGERGLWIRPPTPRLPHSGEGKGGRGPQRASPGTWPLRCPRTLTLPGTLARFPARTPGGWGGVSTGWGLHGITAALGPRPAPRSPRRPGFI